MEKAEKMLELVKLWRLSGLKRLNFCEQHPGLKVSTLSYWIGKFNKMNNSSQFIELSGVSSSAELLLIYPNGVQLCTSSSDMHLVGHLIRIYLCLAWGPSFVIFCM